MTQVAVTPSEAESLYGLKKRLQQRILELDAAKLKGTMDEAELSKATDEAYSEFNQGMRTLLGDERYAKSQQMDEAFVTDYFRYQVAKANPTEAQFQELLKVEEEWKKARMEVEHQFEDNTVSPEFQEKLKALDAAHDQDYQRILGADAFNDLQKQQDPTYSQMKKYESLWGLDDSKIDYVYRTMQQYQKDTQDYQAQVLAQQAAGQNVDWETVNNKLRQSANQTQQALQDRLGYDSFNRLQRNRLLRWVGLATQQTPVNSGAGTPPCPWRDGQACRKLGSALFRFNQTQSSHEFEANCAICFMSSEFRHRASLGLNVVLPLIAMVLVFYRSEPAGASKVSPQRPDDTPARVRQPQSPHYPSMASASDQRRWLVDQLRAMGVPNRVLARIVLADLDWAWNKRGGEVSLKSRGDPDTMAAFKLENAKSLDGEMRAALGEAGFREWDQGNMLREANQGKIALSAAETSASYDLWKKLQQRELELKEAKLKGEMDDAEAGDAYDKASSEYNQQMKALLGDERYAKLQQTDDGTGATSLKQDLAKANPSDSQFQDLLKAQQQWNESRSKLDQQFQNDPTSAAYADQLKALNDARDQTYQQVLGADAFNTLQKDQDPGYSQMKKYESLWGLDDTQIDSVYGTLKYYNKAVLDYQAQAQALEAQGQQVDWDAVNKNLQQFANQTQQSLQNYVGQGTFNKMQQNGVFTLSPPVLPLAHSKP